MDEYAASTTFKAGIFKDTMRIWKAIPTGFQWFLGVIATLGAFENPNPRGQSDQQIL